MEIALDTHDYQVSESSSDRNPLVARIQDEALAVRKKLASEPIDTKTSSSTAAFVYTADTVLASATDITAGIDDFLSRQLTGLIVDTEASVKKWDIRTLFANNLVVSFTHQPSKYTFVNTTTSDLISFIRNHLRLAHASNIASRLEYLRETCIEEAPEQAPISVQSLQGFIFFLQRESNLAEPDIVITYAGNIRAEWHRSRKEHFAVEFLPTGQVRYVVFSSDLNHPSRTDRTFGVVSAESLMGKVSPFNVLSWSQN